MAVVRSSKTLEKSRVFLFPRNQKKYADHSKNPKLDKCFARHDYQNLNLITMKKKSGVELLALDRANKRKVLFVFRKAKGIDDTANAYFADRLELNARAFFDQLKALKSRLYSE